MSDEKTPAKRGRKPYPRFKVTVPVGATPVEVTVGSPDAAGAIARAKAMHKRGRLPKPELVPLFGDASAEPV